MPATEALRDDLERLRAAHRLRAVRTPAGVDFSSNDYLGLARSPRLREAVARALAEGVAIGSGGSRLLRGNDTQHARLEGEAARLFGAEDALFFANGYTANLALFGAVPQRGDLVIHDALIHASARDGMRLGRAETAEAAHNDPQAFRDIATDWRRRGGGYSARAMKSLVLRQMVVAALLLHYSTNQSLFYFSLGGLQLCKISRF